MLLLCIALRFGRRGIKIIDGRQKLGEDKAEKEKEGEDVAEFNHKMRELGPLPSPHLYYTTAFYSITLSSSSRVVMPSKTFCMPSWARVVMFCWMASSRIS